ncbi:MAG: RNA-binding protein [Bacteroidales bacterium]|nr:RNA-binding protein [Bacteroidales bacterium]
MNLYIGNLDYKVREQQLEELFAEYGEVTSVKIIKDKFSGRSKGFGFVEMADDNGGKEAINALNGKPLLDREIIVSEARPKTENNR